MNETVCLRATITWEYDAEPSFYETFDPAEMAKLDQERISSDFTLAYYPTKVTVEVVEAET